MINGLDMLLKEEQERLKYVYAPITYLFIFNHTVYIDVFVYEM